MNDATIDHLSPSNLRLSPTQTTTGALALVFGTAMAAGQPVWPTQQVAHYGIAQTAPSYSQVAEQVMREAAQRPDADFALRIASIYASITERQQRLGEDFESAIFDDLDSLYET